MRLATYNVHHGAPSRGRVDLDATIGVCRALRSDVLAVQELDSFASRSGRIDQPSVLAEALGMFVAFATTVRLDERGHYGHALFSVHRLIDVETVELVVSPGREPRAAILASTEVDGVPLEVAAVHLENPRRGHDPSKTIEQAAAVFARAISRADATGNVAVVMGDLNLGATTTRSLAEGSGFALAAGPNTFPSHRPHQRIDHIALRGGSIEHVEVPASDASDHRPLLVIADADRRRPA
jgi:endonuclease/exonuclease/phosphatase family metal-dependent hydrolase